MTHILTVPNTLLNLYNIMAQVYFIIYTETTKEIFNENYFTVFNTKR